VCGGVVYGLPLTAVAGFSSVPPRCAEATHKPTVGKHCMRRLAQASHCYFAYVEFYCARALLVLKGFGLRG
jgi:hypothetical protein